jgi:hypothetical protein
MWNTGGPISAPAADEIAHRAGFPYAERFVRKYADRLVHISDRTGEVIKTAKPPKAKMGNVVRLLRNRRTLFKAASTLHCRPKRLAPISKARAGINAIYEKLKKIWWPLHPRCEFVDPKTGKQCRRKSSPRPHHIKRRGRYLCDTTTWMGICEGAGSHHAWIHDNEKEAEAIGYLVRERKTNTGLKLPPIITPFDQVR